MPVASVNGQEVHYSDSGGDGPAIVFLHGFLFDESMFAPQFEALSPQYRCIAFDARGFGQTKWDGEKFTLYDTVADCIALLDELGVQKASFVGMSQGGYATLRLAIKHPERVNSLVFLSTYNGVDTDDVKSIYLSMRDTWREHGPAPVVGSLLDLFLGTVDVAGDLRAEWEPKWSARTGDEIFHTINNLIERDAIDAEQVATVTAPAMVIHSEGDQGIPIVLGETLFNSLPNGKQMIRIPDAPHAVNLTHPEPVNDALKRFFGEFA